MVVMEAPAVPKLDPPRHKEDVRCNACSKLLFKKTSKEVAVARSLRCGIEIKCKCGHVNFV